MIDLGAINDTNDEQDLKARVLGELPPQYQPNPNAAMSDSGNSDLPAQYRIGPTFGERIGAKPASAQPQPATPPAPPPAPPQIQIDASKLPPGILPSTAKVDATVPSYGSPQPPSVQLPPATMPSGILRTNVSPGEVPSPTASSPATTVLPNLMQQRLQAAAPIDPKAVDPATGKPMYRMGWGQRIAGTAANFLHGFARDGAAPIYVGPGATNSRFARDTAMQGQKVAGLDTDIGNQEKLAELQQKGYKDAVDQAFKGEEADYRERLADAAERNAETKGQLVDTQNQLRVSQANEHNAKANKLETTEEPKTEVEVANAYQTALMKGDKPGAAKYKGVLNLLKQQKAAGKDTSAADLQKYLQVSEFKIRQHQAIDNEREKERVALYADADKQGKQTFDIKGERTTARKAEIDRQLDEKYKPQHDSVDAQADQMMGLTKTGARIRQQGAPASPPQAGHQPVNSVGKYKVGAVVNLKGKGPVKITKLYSDGKFEYEAAK